MIETQCVRCSKPLNGGVFRKPNQCPHCFNLQDESLTARGRSRPGYVAKAEQKKVTKTVKKKATFAANAPSEQIEVAEIPAASLAKVIQKENRVKKSPASNTQKKTTIQKKVEKHIEPQLDIQPLKSTQKPVAKVQTKKAVAKAQANKNTETQIKVSTKPAKVSAKPAKVSTPTQPKASNDDTSQKPLATKVEETGTPFHPLYLELKPDMSLSLDIHLKMPTKKVKADVVSLKAKVSKAQKAAQLRAKKAEQATSAPIAETAL